MQANYFTGNVFQMLGVPALIGRYFLPADAPDGQDPQPVVVLSYKFWMHHFNGDRSVVGKTIQLVRKTYTVIGVMPPHFGFLGADVYLPLNFQIHADGNFNIRQKTPVFTTNNNVFLIDAWVGKKLLKNNQLLLKAAVNDLLNQNNGFNRNVSSSFITQNTYSTIKRYFMFSVVWNFTKAGTPAPRQGN